ncbi:sodium/potassium-transporting ATPase subunit gamma-like [Channa argus]|uniref:sodium/potassium-transporting ATPase subunit gamma-like n=1 Tax=Channa argus TaxID=215402 RepID=UPI00294421E5|nr:hypothetical protein Q8A73_006625 [Channa argus]
MGVWCAPAPVADGATHTYIHLDRGDTEFLAAQFGQLNTHRQANMSSPKGADIDPDADFVYDYYTLRLGGLIFAGVIVFLSILLLAGNKIRKCGKSKSRQVEQD